ncbi:phosphatidate cytidylyltransferase [Patellaria atrata CBS 101060]|uniref:Phosphatidate cytidylyltransferase n=1 Tax=Patellaria atrata CBS 101060 TaxID=1346257 RepID=A0A9P4SCM6_9PEZI|nr:phosphatidate cytidylyltransferase [Patellaria atrata CBS 101060]
MSSSHVPATPRVISPSPTPSETSEHSYFGPVTRSISRANRTVKSPPPIDEDGSSSDPEKRARTRSRSPLLDGSRRRRMSGLTAINPKGRTSSISSSKGLRKRPDLALPNGSANGHLSPQSAAKNYWREMSRSPSPLGLIPIHQEWRSFIHRHEIPRKILHVSIGFFSLYLYVAGYQPSQIHPVLLSMLIPIAATDFIRHRNPSVNHFYIRCLGALMRESEVDGYNGVISYLLGVFIVLRFFPKDVGVMGVLLLSWCDTAASTFGRLWGKYTPKIRRGKSLAGSIAAMLTGVLTAATFWGYIAPVWGSALDQGEHAFAFQGFLSLPSQVQKLVGVKETSTVITGGLALGVMSVWAGFVAAASEAVDLFGWDDNLTIPVLCGAGLWGFLKTFA